MSGADQQRGNGESILLKERFLIYPTAPVPELDTGTAQAFVAEDRRQGERKMFALVQRPGLPLRMHHLRANASLPPSGILNLADHGIVEWPSIDHKVMALIYERPLGGPVIPNPEEPFQRMEENDVVRKLLTPISTLLKELRSRGLTHRGIRPTNLFWTNPEKTAMVLGDFITEPAGLSQPMLFEPIEMGLCHPTGRGEGSIACDYYALGVTLMVLLAGQFPLRGLEDEVILQGKITSGSYSMMAMEQRLPPQMIEVLRGLLVDDPAERWGADAVDQWLGGRRQSPLLAKPERRAARPYNFLSKDYHTARDLSRVFAENWEQAKAVMFDGTLEPWVARSLGRKEAGTAIGSSLRWASIAASDANKVLHDWTLSKVCMMLDPGAPIRYKGLSFMPDGYGLVLAVTMIEGADVKLPCEVLTREIGRAWLESRVTNSSENASIESGYRLAKTYLERTGLGYGLERALYEMHEFMPCMSPLVSREHVVDIRDMLPALERLAERSGQDGRKSPLDRHVLAFIGARTSFDVDRQLIEMGDTDPAKAMLGMVNLLALLQWRLGQLELPSLTQWVGTMVAPVIDSYHNRETRKALRERLPMTLRDGNLVSLTRLLDDPVERQKDRMGYEQAQHEWMQAQHEIEQIQSGNFGDEREQNRAAHQFAVLLSLTVAILTTCVMLLAKIF